MTQSKRFFVNKGFSKSNLISQEIIEYAKREGQKAIPQIAKNPQLIRAIQNTIKEYPTEHQFFNGDSRDMDNILIRAFT